MDHAHFRVGAVPVRGDRIEDQPEVLLASGLERGRGDRLKIDIRLSHADEHKRMGLVLRHFVGGVAEEHLHGDAGDGAAAQVGDVPVQVGDLAAGQVGRFAHGQASDGQAGRVRVGSRRDGRHCGPAPAVFEGNHSHGSHHNNNHGSHRQRQPVAFARPGGRDWIEIGVHERNFTPVTEGIP